MKTNMIIVALLFATSSLFSQTNLLTDGSFELMPVGTKNFVVNNGGKVTGKSGKWQVAFAKGGCEGGCCEGTAEITASAKKVGNNSLTLTILRQTNRNDVKVLQSINAVPAGIYEASFWVKSDVADCPIAVDVLMATQPNSNNGKDPFTGNFTTSTEWKQIKLKVDISAWTDEERNEMRVSIRPNNTKKLPEGPYPKTFWIDDVVFSAVK